MLRFSGNYFRTPNKFLLKIVWCKLPYLIGGVRNWLTSEQHFRQLATRVSKADGGQLLELRCDVVTTVDKEHIFEDCA